ncbi:MAG: methylmalonyl Co-A mutase-associated GTPase MeaB [Lutibacter sp.]|nr:methylmalonyl Co-A mutase-associated GTPase MeaB [Lutibacter sp.]
MPAKKSSARTLKEVDGAKPSSSLRDTAVQQFKKQQRKAPSTDTFVKHILKGDISYLSRAITLVESTRSADQQKAHHILEKCLPHANQSIRIGITGVPGVGKSTFIEAFAKCFTQKNRKVAVLAIDPSSTIYKGSILGDKTRMEALVKDPNAYIRPSPSGDALGGVARKTRESIILCEAAGFDTIFIETVGVGQNETAVHSMVDFFLLLKLGGAGDALQGIKRGIIEMADAIVINKADQGNQKATELARTEFSRALELYPLKDSHWKPPVSTCSAVCNQGIEPVYETIIRYISLVKKSGYFDKHREKQNNYWLRETVQQQLSHEFYQNKIVQQALKKYAKAVQQSTMTPFKAAEALLTLSKEQR